MENTCRMDCHGCTLQENVGNKALCATLLMPAMLGRIERRLQRIESLLSGSSKAELNEVVLNDELNDQKE